MDDQVNAAIETALNTIRTYFQEASTVIEALQGDDKVAATRLAETIALKHGTTKAAMYPVLKVLFDVYPNVDITAGAHGGIRKRKPSSEVK